MERGLHSQVKYLAPFFLGRQLSSIIFGGEKVLDLNFLAQLLRAVVLAQARCQRGSLASWPCASPAALLGGRKTLTYSLPNILFYASPSEDLAICVRCRRKMPDDVKILDDPSYKPKPDSTELMGTKKLRLARYYT